MIFIFREYCSRFKNPETKLFCVRVMVGVIILYDHVHPVGAFARSSGIDVSTTFPNLCESTGKQFYFCEKKWHKFKKLT